MERHGIVANDDGGARRNEPKPKVSGSGQRVVRKSSTIAATDRANQHNTPA
jgi:hypothetical protein